MNTFDINNLDFIEKEIHRFLASQRRRDMLMGERYHEGKHDILHRKREVIGADGDLTEVKNLPNNRVVDNQYKKVTDQKVNYFLGQPLVFQSDNTQYSILLKSVFNKRFLRLLKNVGENSLNCGIGWVFVYYDDNGQIAFRRIKPYELIAGWEDEEHTQLDYAIRVYETKDPSTEKTVKKVEVYHRQGISRYIFEGAKLKIDPDYATIEPYLTIGKQGYNWDTLPLIPFKYNNKEIPLILNVKSLQDGLNTILSNFQNNMEEDSRNTILVIVNYDGENLGDFRKNLATYGAVKVRNTEGAKGGVESLQIEVDADNYKTILDIFRKAIIENAMGFDAKDVSLGRYSNEMNIQSMYSDIDLDTNKMETEYQASFEDLLYFVNLHFINTGAGDFRSEEVEVIFNRDMLMSESEAIQSIKNSVGILAHETLVAQHPWVDDVNAELERQKAEKQAQQTQEENAQYGNAFGGNNHTLVTKDEENP